MRQAVYVRVLPSFTLHVLSIVIFCTCACINNNSVTEQCRLWSELILFMEFYGQIMLTTFTITGTCEIAMESANMWKGIWNCNWT